MVGPAKKVKGRPTYASGSATRISAVLSLALISFVHALWRADWRRDAYEGRGQHIGPLCLACGHFGSVHTGEGRRPPAEPAASPSVSRERRCSTPGSGTGSRRRRT